MTNRYKMFWKWSGISPQSAAAKQAYTGCDVTLSLGTIVRIRTRLFQLNKKDLVKQKGSDFKKKVYICRDQDHFHTANGAWNKPVVDILLQVNVIYCHKIFFTNWQVRLDTVLWNPLFPMVCIKAVDAAQFTEHAPNQAETKLKLRFVWKGLHRAQV